MAIVPTHLYNVTFNSSDLMQVLILIKKNEDKMFPLDSKLLANNVKGVTVMDLENPYNETLEKMYHLLDNLGAEKVTSEYNGEQLSITTANKLIDEVSEKLDLAVKIRDEIVTVREENFSAIQILNEISNQNINLDEIEATQFIKCRFGRIPVNEYEKLKYYNEYPFIFKEYSQNKDYVWGIYTGLTKDIAEIDNLFDSVSFELVKLPDFAHGTLDNAVSELQTECEAMKNYIGHINERIEVISQEYQEKVLSAFTTIYNLKLLFDQARYVVDYSNKKAIYAFSTLSILEVEGIFKGIEGVRILQLPKNIYNSRGIEPPVITHNNFFVKSFEGILKPRHKDTLDPAPFLAIGYSLMAALFLGDLGWGALIMIVGVLFGHRTTNIGRILMTLGGCGFIGGLFYGSIFDTYQLYPAIIMTPLQPIHKIGYFFIGVVLLTVILAIVRGMTSKKVEF